MSLPLQERTIRACEACHKSKCKCINDGTAENPCTNCFKKGIPCVYKEAKKRGPRPGMMKALQDIVDELQSKLDDVTRRLEFSNKQLEILKGKSNNVQYHQSRLVVRRFINGVFHPGLSGIIIAFDNPLCLSVIFTQYTPLFTHITSSLLALSCSRWRIHYYCAILKQ